jgi:uncharacterized protein DUF2147
MKLLGGVVAVLLAAQPAWADAPTVSGIWQQIDPDTGKVGALVTFAERRGIFEGRISKLFPEPGDETNPLCRKCPGDRQNKPILGLLFIEGMKRTGLDYGGGTILDPDSGTFYNASMQLSPDGNTLTVRGYVGIPLFGQSQTWKRVP